MRQIRVYVACAFILTLSLLETPTIAVADELEEISALQKQVHTLLDAGHYSRAEPLARKVVAIAERSFANHNSKCRAMSPRFSWA